MSTTQEKPFRLNFATAGVRVNLNEALMTFFGTVFEAHHWIKNNPTAGREYFIEFIKPPVDGVVYSAWGWEETNEYDTDDIEHDYLATRDLMIRHNDAEFWYQHSQKKEQVLASRGIMYPLFRHNHIPKVTMSRLRDPYYLATLYTYDSVNITYMDNGIQFEPIIIKD